VSHVKEAFLLLIRLMLVCVAMAIAYVLSEQLLGQNDVQLTADEARWAGVALLLVSAINALVLAYPILRSRWHGLALAGALILAQFGTETFITQVETFYFNRALQLDPAELLGIVKAGALRALIFAPLAVLILGRLKRPVGPEKPRTKVALSGGITRFAGLAVLYVVVYFAFGYFVAWQWPETRLFYSGTEAIKPFFAHFRDLFQADPIIVPFQLLRGALWAALALLVAGMMRARRWETSLAVALLFAGLLCSGLALFPNPYMPQAVRESHLYEILFSMLLFGGLAGWVMYRGKRDAPAKEPVGKPVLGFSP
jgi:hypothetical protein